MSASQRFPQKTTIVIAAFGGWSDAGETATDTIEHLLEVWDCDEIFEIAPDNYYDYQFSRPEAAIGLTGEREIIWPGASVYKTSSATLPDSEIYLIQGMEPSKRWKQFCAEIMNVIPTDHDTVIIGLGAMLADVPHTRPIPINGTTSNRILQEVTGFESSKYEGPTGILGILQAECDAVGISGISLWAAIPHYVANPPCPKATLALIRGLEDVLNTSIPVADLVEESRDWETGVEELTKDDDDIAEYVRNLEESQDAAELPEASGEAIAKEFERYLRRRES